MNEGCEPDEHNYIFVGKVGSFCPIKKGCGGGELLREKDGKYYSATGAKGYRWLESEVVKSNDMMDDIDISYFVKMADNAVATCQEFGSFEWLVDPAPFNCMIPWETVPRDEEFMNMCIDDEDNPPWNIDANQNNKKEEK